MRLLDDKRRRMAQNSDRRLGQHLAVAGGRQARTIRFAHRLLKAPWAATLKPAESQHSSFIYISKRFLELKKAEALWANVENRAFGYEIESCAYGHPHDRRLWHGLCVKR